MADLDGVLEEEENPEVLAEEPKPEPTVPQYVTADQFMAGLNTIAQSMQQGFSAIAAAGQAGQRVTEPVIEDVSDEELEAQGLDPKLFRKAVEARVAKGERATNAKIEQLSSTGLTSIGGLVKKLAAAEMPYYKRYQQEIDQIIDGLSAEAKLNPENLIAAHRYVVGGHMDEIKAEERQAAIRTLSATTVNTPGKKSGRQAEKPEKRAAVRLSEENKDFLEGLGHDEDSWAQSRGYESWNDYVEKTAVEEDF